MKNYILGINWEQNSSAALFLNGECLGALSNERITRKKNDESYPKDAIDWLLEEFNVTVSEIECVIFVSKQWAPGWILSRHYTSFSMQDYLKEQNEFWYPKIYEGKNLSPLTVFSEKLDLEQFPGEEFWKDIVKKYEGREAHPSNKEIENLGQKVRMKVVEIHLGITKVLFMDHSSCHNAYAYFSQQNRSDTFLSISLDAFGDDINYSAKLYSPSASGVKLTNVVSGNNLIIGRLYRYVTLILGLKPNEHEYKVMGLAPYCKPKYYKHILKMFKGIQDVDGLKFKYVNKPKDHFFDIRKKLYSERFDSIAGGLQAYTEYLVSSWVKNLIKHTKIKNVCFAGGIAMNVKSNMLISKLKDLKDLHVPLTPDDTSQAIGACYQFYHQHTDKSVNPISSPYLGRHCNKLLKQGVNDCDHLKNLLKNADKKENFQFISENYLKEGAQQLASGRVLGVIWGREEFGARALGNRSVVANPMHTYIKKKINETIKDRDFWMPFAASIPEKHAKDYLVLDCNSKAYAYMTNTVESRPLGQKKLLAALHPYDQTCRPHIIPTGGNDIYETLINEFGHITGTYALLNTSLNLHGFPICSDFEDAVHVLLNSNLDGLLTEGMLVMKDLGDAST